MTQLASRISRLEARLRERSAMVPDVRVFFHDELEPCPFHFRCDAEVETGGHHTGVIHLDFDGPSAGNVRP